MGLVVAASAIGIAGSLLGLLGVGMAAMSKGHWGVAVGCLAGFSAILLAVFIGIEYAQDFWEGR